MLSWWSGRCAGCAPTGAVSFYRNRLAPSGEMPDAIGWKRGCHSVLVECKSSRADFLADREKPWRQKPENGAGCERFYLTPARTGPSPGARAGLGPARDR